GLAGQASFLAQHLEMDGDEADGMAPPMVKLGDASIAAPFTSKLPSMQRRKNPAAIAAMKAIKAALDPKGILNPGKLLP
ncbi:MAG: FAD-linked oxidase C-terminal domain-containing protein, partial [Pseudomonadota bacterium]|nr:FAD-linked oxidase C-terminal domain-containing protein [Pseudomonadota bacterium]